jgi:membrane protein DedA with SNARE-associated domain
MNMRRYRLWVACILGPITIALFVLTVIAAVTGFLPWPPLLAGALAATMGGGALFVMGPRAIREQERARRSEQEQRDR